MSKWLNIAFAGGIVVASLVGAAWDPSDEIVPDLWFGWAPYLSNTLPKVTVRWDGMWWFCISLICAMVVFHLLITSIMNRVKSAEQRASKPWRWRWSLILPALTVVMFTAGISLVGITHQAAWLLTSSVPLYGESPKLGSDESSKWNLKWLGLGVITATEVTGLPPKLRLAESDPPQSWIYATLGYIGGGYLLPRIDHKLPWNHPVNAPHFQKLVPELLNPGFRNFPARDENGFGLSHYAGNRNLFSRPYDKDASIPNQSNLLLIGEVNSQFEPWGQPGNARDPAAGINTPHGFGGVPGTGETLFVMADGSVRRISNTIDAKAFEALGQPQ